MRTHIFRICAGAALCLLLTGCGQQHVMPEIVFLKRHSAAISGDAEESGSRNSVAFFDRNGQYYTCGDAAFVNQYDAELCRQFAEGNAPVTKSSISCDPAKLQTQYDRIMRVLPDDPALDVPDALPAVEADSDYWYCLCPDADGQIQAFRIHANICMTDIYSTDETVNAVYKWYSETVRQEGTS